MCFFEPYQMCLGGRKGRNRLLDGGQGVAEGPVADVDAEVERMRAEALGTPPPSSSSSAAAAKKGGGR